MAPEIPFSYSTVVASVSGAIDQICRKLLSQLKATGFSQDDTFAVHLAVEEAFVNAITHGNKMDPNKKVKVDYSVDSDKVEIFLADEGEGFDPDSVPDPRYGQNLYRAKGRGLLLIRSYMDVVEFNKQGNSLHLVKHKSNKFKTNDAKTVA